ncbi:MAG: DNA-directed RNA polymerase [Thelocarpon impressellum]|nr:MAG: DNA-directed RNA polymerase [Thelocarpon impressellum]
MLLRAARAGGPRYDPARIAAQASEGLLLPWLCPAQLRYRQSQQSRRAISASSPSEGRPRAFRDRTTLETRPRHGSRHLASAAAERSTIHEDDVPFEGQPPPQSDWLRSRGISALRDFDPASPIIVNDSLATPPRTFSHHDGFRGSLAELHLTIEACLQVGRLDRAAALVRRLGQIYAPDAPELRHAHNSYLRSVVARILHTRSEDGLKSVQRWFEVEMRNKGVGPDATTFALLIKASLQLLQGAKTDRTVRRYMDLATEAGHEVELLNLPILSDAELYKVTAICPTEFYLFPGETSTPDGSAATSTGALERTGDAVDALPDVRPAGVKGLSLDALHKSLSIFADSTVPYPDHLEGSQEDKDRAYAELRQRRLEQDAVSSAIERWRVESEDMKKMGINTALKTNPLASLMWEWFNALTVSLKDEFRQIDAAEARPTKNALDRDRCLYGTFLRLVPVEKLAAITILATMAGFSSRKADRGLKLSSLVMSVAEAVEDESVAIAIQTGFREDKFRWQGRTSTVDRQRRLAASMKTRKSFVRLSRVAEGGREKDKHTNAATASGVDLAPSPNWTAAIRAKVGAVLVSSLISNAKMPVKRRHPDTQRDVVQEQPVFFHSYQFREGKRIGVVSANAALIADLKTEPHHIALAKHLPMVAPPRKWTGFEEGGYLQYSVRAMRTRGSDRSQRHYFEAAAAHGDMDQVFAALDVLSQTPWKINKGVLDVMVKAWDTGEATANIAPEKPQMDYPPEPAPTADAREKRLWATAVKEVDNERSGLHSQRCFQNLQLEIARAFSKEKFYFPHNLDFRGRAYPIPPYLNHMGADHCRGLLIFAEAKELGSKGLVWLKVHLANVFGYDKASFSEREEFTMEHLSDICDSAVNPLAGRRWWLTAEDPWQCLAACMELKSALDSPDPTRFRSSLAIHQDGTCNGLQHYAALGGDLWGAKQVNLEPSDRPADVYTGVAELVKKEISDDAAAGNAMAKILDGKVTRKVVKQTVMTNVYGVTFVGAQAQVWKQLDVIMPADKQEQAEFSNKQLASYVVRKIFRALSSMFRGAHDIQYWFAECASRISQALTPEQLDELERGSAAQGRGKAKTKARLEHSRFKSAVVWTTPLKMPVVQPYRTQKARRVTTNLQRVSIMEPSNSDPVSKRKQLQGFPPNFIHSLDATHMLLSALKCDEVGLTFAAVHDSFWTHAADVNTMNRILRDAFIRMHQEDIVARLAAEFNARYKHCMYMAAVRPDSAVGKQIRAFRVSRPRDGSSAKDGLAELLQEKRRTQLLRSSDPAEVEEGKAMVTPGSIFEAVTAADTQDHLEPPEAMAELGKLPGRSQPKGKADVEAGEETEATAESLEGEGDGPPKKKAQKTPVTFWLPLTFPPVPKKGEFDVSRLKDSLYFFS